MAGKKNKNRRHPFRAFLSFYTKFRIPWWLYILSMGCGFAATAITVHINKYTIAFNQGELYNRVIIAYAAWTLISAAITVILNIAVNYGDEKISLRAREIVWKHILCLPMKIFHKEKPYETVSSITNEIPQASMLINMLSAFLASVYGFITAVIVLAKFNATMLRYMLVLIPLAILQFWAIGRLQMYMYKRRYGALNKMTAFFAEHLKCGRQIKAQGLEEEEIKAGAEAINEQFKADLVFGFLFTAQTLINSIYQTAYTIFIAIFGSRMIRRGRMDSSGILTFQTYWSTQDRYLSEILTQYQNVKGTQGALEKVTDVLSYETEETRDANGPVCPAGNIVLENVSFGYPDGEEVLHDVNCTVPYGKSVAVIGANGSGKSTFFKLLLRLYEPDSGRIYIEGQTEQEDLHAWRSHFGYAAQNTALFSGTIKENILYSCGDLSDGELERLCAAVNLDEVLAEKENGLDEEAGEAGCRLSGGQQQRVAIARALAAKPGYLMLDEATSQLDFVNDRIIEENTRAQMEERSVIFIAHNIASARRADVIMLFDNGRLINMGTDSELMERCKLYREYVIISEGGSIDEEV